MNRDLIRTFRANFWALVRQRRVPPTNHPDEAPSPFLHAPTRSDPNEKDDDNG